MTSKLISTIRNLRYRKARRRRGLGVLDGVRLVEEAIDANLVIRGAVVADDADTGERIQSIIHRLESASLPLERIGRTEFDEIIQTETSQGILAVVEQTSTNVSDIEIGAGGLGLALDAVQDPGNVGTMIRSAHALGASAVFLLSGTADLWNPKVLRAAMGSSFKLPVAVADHVEFLGWKMSHEVEVVAGDVGGIPIDGFGKRSTPRVLIVSNEGAGISPEIQNVVDERIGIPIVDDAESLNVATAAGILMHELLKGRHK